MKAFDFQTAARWCGGEISVGDQGCPIASVTTDTRGLRGGELFVALAGENFDAHDFLDVAREGGAVGAIVSRIPEGFRERENFGLILVEDTLVALQSLAKGYRDDLDPVVVAVTGSNGKTSTKDFLKAALGTKFRVHATSGNLNNHIGLPLTLLSAPEDTECLVCEIGMSNPGEIAPLAAIANPDVAVVTNVGTAHIEFMGSREAIALEKGMLAEAVGAGGTVVLNAEDDFSGEIAARTEAKVMLAGVGKGCVRADELDSSGSGICFSLNTSEYNAGVDLQVPGRHMVANATIAAAAALALGCDLVEVARALSAAELTGGRLQRKQVAGFDILDDSYNANPDSVRAAVATLKSLPCSGRRIAVLGRMAEIGDEAGAAHARVGKFAAEQGIDLIFSVGAEDASFITSAASGAGMNGRALHFQSASECADHLSGDATPEDIILIKGSRSSHMEAVIELLSSPS